MPQKSLIQIRSFFPIVIILFEFLAAGFVNAQNEEVVLITYQNERLRSIAEQYLGNPDYWEIILSYNNLKSVSELKSGMKLKIPVGLVSATLERISEASEIIGKANENGAKIFTPDLILEAEKYSNSSLRLKKSGEWRKAESSAAKAFKMGKASLERSLLFRNKSADATITYAEGTVQKKRPNQKLWSEGKLFSKLYEADRARTLSNSLAEITFIDLSRIRLNENSQAVIEHTRIDELKNKTETKIKLVIGDAFAYLMKSPKKKFDIDAPGLNVDIRSKSFWVNREPDKTKIANYEGEIELTANDSSVVVQKNQGTVVPDGNAPAKPKDLLPPPELTAPGNMSKFYDDDISFSWKKIDKAEKYWLEIASDVSFRTIVYSNKNISNTSQKVKLPKLNVYFWRVCSIDESALPGEFSRYKYFMITKDEEKPFLIVALPENFLATKNSSVAVSGESEPGTSVIINGDSVKPDNRGNFKKVLKLKNGINIVAISSVDENENVSEITRIVFYESSGEIENKITNENFSPEENLFYVSAPLLAVRGKTRPLSKIIFIFNEKNVTAFADTNGNYSQTIIVNGNSGKLSQIITSPAGYVKNFSYAVRAIDKTPKIKFSAKIPAAVKKDAFIIVGSITNADSLFINSEPVSFGGGKFQKSLKLKEGKNDFVFTAKNGSGNFDRKSFSIIKDSTPPEIVSHKITRDGNKIMITVKVKDDIYLKKTARAIIATGKQKMETFLLLNKYKSEYSKTIYLSEPSSKEKLISIEVGDYLGNSKKYELTK
ncbi:MAG: FecR domain-containing protein [Chlorobi bacterium]|nr:FecR domain-containing protein [Chlorobiota bacterium]